MMTLHECDAGFSKKLRETCGSDRVVCFKCYKRERSNLTMELEELNEKFGGLKRRSNSQIEQL